jgi:hypothetical protein
MGVAMAQIVLLGGIIFVLFVFLIVLIFYGQSFSGSLNLGAVALAGSLSGAIANLGQFVDYVVVSLGSFVSFMISQFESFLGNSTYVAEGVGIVAGFGLIGPFLSKQLAAIIQTASSNILNVAGDITRYITQTYNSIANGIFAVGDTYLSMGTASVSGIAGLVTQGFGVFFNFIAQGVSTIGNYMSSIFASVLGVVGQVIDISIDGINIAIAATIEAFDDLETGFNIAYNAIRGLIDEALTALRAVVCDIVGGMLVLICEICEGIASGSSCNFCKQGSGCSPWCLVCPASNPGCYGSC